MKRIWSMQSIYLMYGLSIMLAVWAAYNFMQIPSVKETLPVVFAGFYGFRHVAIGFNYDTFFLIGEILFFFVAFLRALMWTLMNRNLSIVMTWLVVALGYSVIAYGLV